MISLVNDISFMETILCKTRIVLDGCGLCLFSVYFQYLPGTPQYSVLLLYMRLHSTCTNDTRLVC